MTIIAGRQRNVLPALVAVLILSAAGCGNAEPIVGLEPAERPRMKQVEGPGFTMEIQEKWSSQIDGSRLIVTPPADESRVKFIVEVLPYQSGETSENILQAAEDSRKELRNVHHTQGALNGVPYYRCLYARNPKERVFDSGLYLMAHPGKKTIGTIEFGSMKDVIASLVLIELSMQSVRLP